MNAVELCGWQFYAYVSVIIYMSQSSEWLDILICIVDLMVGLYLSPFPFVWECLVVVKAFCTFKICYKVLEELGGKTSSIFEDPLVQEVSSHFGC